MGEEPAPRHEERSAEEVGTARARLEEARRRIHVPHKPRDDQAVSLETAQVAYEMELAEHRDTQERLHKAELAARDLTIEHQRRQVAELEAEVRRLRIALQVLTGRPVPEVGVAPEDG
ncbi:MAG: hypothetical protein ACP5VR_12625 [Acidimicrobiales bacterium]